MHGVKRSVISVAVLLSMTACGKPATKPSEDTGPGDGAARLESAGSSGQVDPLRNAYFGETHVHGAYSLDAYIGGARLEPDEQYRFAKGEPVTLYGLSLIHISEPTRLGMLSRMPSSA